MKTLLCLALMFHVAAPQAYAVYGRLPIEQILRDEQTTVIDATVEELTIQGFAKIKTHTILKGKTSTAVLKGFFMSSGPTVKDRLKEKKRYVFVVKGEEIYELCTYWEVLESFDGELMCYYQRYEPTDGLKNKTIPMLPGSGLYKLSDFQKMIKRVIGKGKHNQQVDPIVKTPVDKVEAQSTQGHP